MRKEVERKGSETGEKWSEMRRKWRETKVKCRRKRNRETKRGIGEQVKWNGEVEEDIGKNGEC